MNSFREHRYVCPPDESLSVASPLEVKQDLGQMLRLGIFVHTATALIHHPDNSHLVLVARNVKHEGFILPGGKFEHKDKSHADPALSCILREVKEEIGTELLNARHIGRRYAIGSDTREVPLETLAGVVCYCPDSVLEVLPGLASETIVRAHYAMPDEIFVGCVKPEEIRETKELWGGHFIDVREIPSDFLSAGHQRIIKWYYNEVLSANT